MSKKSLLSISTSSKNILWNYSGTFISLSVNIFLLPIILVKLKSFEIGLWYVFSNLGMFIQLLDFGFSPTLSRNVTSAWSGSIELKQEGFYEYNHDSANYQLIYDLLKVTKKIYFIISIVALFLLLFPGSLYIYSLIFSNTSSEFYMYTWIFYSLSISANIYFTFWNSFLRGISDFKKLNIINIITKLLFLVLSSIGLFNNLGIFSIVLSQFISGLMHHLLANKAFYNKMTPNFKKTQVSKDNQKKILATIMPNTIKYGLVSFSGFLSQRGDIFLVSSFLGLEKTGSYGLTLQLISILGTLVQIPFSTLTPFFTRSYIKKEYDKILKLFSLTNFLMWSMGLIGIAIILFFGNQILSLLSTDTNLIENYFIIIIALTMLFEWNTTMFINLILASNSVPIVLNSIISGLFIFISSFILLNYSNMGLLSLFVGRLIIGFGFNNWYWPKYAFRMLNTTFKDFTRLYLITLKAKIRFFYFKFFGFLK